MWTNLLMGNLLSSGWIFWNYYNNDKYCEITMTTFFSVQKCVVNKCTIWFLNHVHLTRTHFWESSDPSFIFDAPFFLHTPFLIKNCVCRLSSLHPCLVIIVYVLSNLMIQSLNGFDPLCMFDPTFWISTLWIKIFDLILREGTQTAKRLEMIKITNFSRLWKSF